MTLPLDAFLPSLAALGLWSYWALGLAAFLEAFVPTGLFMPGNLIVEAGGILVQQGLLDYLDLVWFVAAGAILGGEASYSLGRLARRMLSASWQPPKSIAYRKAARLFQRHGGFALMPGRFLGPLFGLVTLVAALAGLPRRRFMIWNIVSAVLYALVHSDVGVLVGGAASRLGPLVNRLGLAIVLLVLALGKGVLTHERLKTEVPDLLDRYRAGDTIGMAEIEALYIAPAKPIEAEATGA